MQTSELQHLQTLVTSLSKTTSSNEKKEILKRFESCKEILRYTYDPFIQFYVTSANLKKRKDLVFDPLAWGWKDNSFEYVLNQISNRYYTGHDAIKYLNSFISHNKEYEELIYRVIDKNLKCRLNTGLINQVWPGLLRKFSVALASKYEDGKVDFEKEEWYVSRKLDGVRVIIVVDNKSDCTFYSRSGKEIYTLQKVADEVKRLRLINIVLDGEVCIEENDKEDFSKIIQEIRRKNHTIEHPKFYIFDTLTHDEFFNCKGDIHLWSRWNYLDPYMIADNKCIDWLRQTRVENLEEFESLRKMAIDSKWEGLILRRNVPYAGERNKDMLKVKAMHDAEYKVLEVQFGPMRVVEDSREVTRETLTNVIIEHKGKRVSVGSGFSLDQRDYYYKNPNKIIGATITVQYFEETTNKDDDSLSLRFPVIKAIYEEGRDI